jgi:host factor-I protein
MTIKGNNVQDLFLNTLRKENIPVLVFLTNGTRLKGVIKSFDNFVIVLKQDKQQLIFKHAISSIVPEKDIDIRREDPRDE